MVNNMAEEKDILKIAQKIAGQLNLKTIHVWKETCSRDITYNPQKVKVNISVEVGILESESEKILPYSCRYSIKANDEEKEKITFEVDITYCVIYQATNGINAEKEEKMAFGLTNAIFNSWPYAREHIQNISMKMGLKPFILPLVKIVDLPKIFKNPKNDK